MNPVTSKLWRNNRTNHPPPPSRDRHALNKNNCEYFKTLPQSYLNKWCRLVFGYKGKNFAELQQSAASYFGKKSFLHRKICKVQLNVIEYFDGRSLGTFPRHYCLLVVAEVLLTSVSHDIIVSGTTTTAATAIIVMITTFHCCIEFIRRRAQHSHYNMCVCLCHTHYLPTSDLSIVFNCPFVLYCSFC